MPVISQLWVYPIKSCQGVAVDSVNLLSSGLEHDREMMIVNADNGRFVTQRSDSVLASIAVSLNKESVILQHAEQGELRFEKTFQVVKSAKVWSRQVPAFDQGDKVAEYLSGIIGCAVRLLATRPTDTLNAERRILFQDGHAVHILSEASLNQVRKSLPAIDIDARRFRPNIVVDNGEGEILAAFAEDSWQHLHTPFTALAVEKLCKRCNVPSINPDNLSVESAVQKYLLAHRMMHGIPCLGVNACGAKLGQLSIGETVTISSRQK